MYQCYNFPNWRLTNHIFQERLQIYFPFEPAHSLPKDVTQKKSM